MSGLVDLELLISLSDISELTKKTPSAVSNWRRRYKDFPLPRVEAATGSLFDFLEVQSWLIGNGRINEPIAPSRLISQIASALRTWAEPSEISRLIIASLVYLEACGKAERPSDEISVELRYRWGEIEQGPEEEIQSRLAVAAQAIEGSNPQLKGLIVPGLTVATSLPRAHVVNLIRVLNVGARDDGTYVGMYEETLEWRNRFDRFQAESATPDDLAHLMALVANRQGSRVFDPAVGEGSVLLLLASMRGPDDVEPELIGFEINPEVLDQCRSAFFIYGEKAELRCVDSLETSEIHDAAADVVVLDPPVLFNRVTPAAGLKTTFEVSYIGESEFEWLEAAFLGLLQDGVGLVLMPKSAAFSEGADSKIRQQIFNDGIVVALISLPSNIRRDTRMQQMLWVIRRPFEGVVSAEDVLLIDATELGRAGREQHQFQEDELESLAAAINARLLGQTPDENSGLTQALFPIAELREGDIAKAFQQLRPVQRVDVDELMSAGEILRQRLTTSIEESQRAVARLLSALEEKV